MSFVRPVVLRAGGNLHRESSNKKLEAHVVALLQLSAPAHSHQHRNLDGHSWQAQGASDDLVVLDGLCSVEANPTLTDVLHLRLDQPIRTADVNRRRRLSRRRLIKVTRMLASLFLSGRH